MEQTKQITLGREILSALQARRTAMADAVYENPVSDYISPVQAAVEQRLLFQQHPLVMALSGDLPEPGDFLTNDLSGRPILLVRGDDGKVNAFLNVCRHRGTKLAQGCGKGQKAFVCPYHAWTYGRDGRLLGITEDKIFGPIDKDSHGLRRLPVAERDGLIWVSATPGGS